MGSSRLFLSVSHTPEASAVLIKGGVLVVQPSVGPVRLQPPISHPVATSLEIVSAGPVVAGARSAPASVAHTSTVAPAP